MSVAFPGFDRCRATTRSIFTRVEGLYSRRTRRTGRPGATLSPGLSDHPRDRAAIAAILAAQQNARSAPAEARTAAARLADASTVAMVTGQQAGAFGGPLFSLLKALTALRLARRHRRRTTVPAVAIFWVDAEDHDWEEVRRCTVLDAEFQPRTVTLADVEGAGELPVGRSRWTPGRAHHAGARRTHYRRPNSPPPSSTT